ncbi:unnamed protein product [Thlaspi arvense]|uniref:Origin recognition complex-associated protein n=1 Tax=Thlaspi arvense TaxID=13288 RepID=A0AAU9RQR2_THLAR|nr:unnamed protein product [Thlaspi arvense]
MAMAAPRKLRGHKSTVTCCIASRDRPGLVVSSGEDGCICWFDLRCKDVQFTIDVGTEPVSSLCFKTGNEHVLYASSGNEIKSFDVHTLSSSSWKPLESYSYNKDEINQVVCNGKSSFLASADDSGDVKIIDIGSDTQSTSGQCLNPAFVHSIAVPEIDMVDKLDKICAVARGDGVVDLINIESELSRKVTSSKTSKGGSSSSNDNVIKRVRLDYSVGGHKAAVSCVSFSLFPEKGRFLVSGGNDKTVKIWDCFKCLDSDNNNNNDNRGFLHMNIDLTKKVNWLCTNQSDSENLVVCDTTRVVKWTFFKWLLDTQVSYLFLLGSYKCHKTVPFSTIPKISLLTTMKPQRTQPRPLVFFFLLLLLATVSSSSPLDPKQLKALKSLKTITTTKDPCNNNKNHSSSSITCDSASPFRHVTSLSFTNRSSVSLYSKTLKPLSKSLLSLSFNNCPSLSPPHHLPTSLHSFSAVSSFHRHGLSGVFLARLVNLTSLSIISTPISTSGLYVILGNMRKITSLTISNSKLSGKIPKSFHSNLTYVDLSNNLLRGTIRTSITLLSGLKSLNLSHNSLSGQIHYGIGDLIWLKNLSLASNELSGPIPNSISSMPELTHLDLSRNQLNGTVPSFFSEMKNLKHLKLADNSFHGVLPFNESFIKSLEVFEIGGNSGLCYNHTVLSSKLNLGIAPCDKYGLPISSPPQKEDSTSEEEDDYDGEENEVKKEEHHGSDKTVLGVAIVLSSLVFLIIFLILLAKWCS